MIEYMASRIAQMEFEERVRRLTPVYDDEWLKDDRKLSVTPIYGGIANLDKDEANWTARQLGRLFYAVGSGLVATGEWMRQRQPYRNNRSVLN